MSERDTGRVGTDGRIVRPRRPRRPAPPARTPTETREVTPQERAPNRSAWPGPLDDEERAALEAGWGFVE
ncbi:hypothetical protein [Methylobacterium aerolatum]|uniref:Uncharacterized protein n=1 Tax=Methylobacterium aerolatum TaxID=418708 RepID=A0ABU0I3F7_9HYPH|nr:hypothetical protein [Methylobacterium aerolatum]MDQ0449133.1 hypothetical protein [Methylobacterium aerolatum]GJD35321.1 hypothetical protein FMGBMHLM_2231 [Methylobacterium aerolatum]